MARPRKYVRDGNGNTVDGVSHHSSGGYYIINPETGEREHFGKGRSALARAQRKYARLKDVPRMVPATSREAARCPELPGCTSAGQTEAEALENIREAIELYVQPDAVEVVPDAITREIIV